MALLRDLLPAFVCLFGACALGLDVGTCPPITSKTAGRVGLGLPAGLAAAGPRPDRASLLQRRTLVPLLHVPCGVRLRGGGTSSIDAAVDLKNRGNAMFREGKFDEAKTMYDAALDSLPKGESANRERANCHNNRAACHVKLGDFVRCVEDCTAVLDIDPPNEKARLRRGIAFETLELKGKAAADMVLLLIEKPDQLQARECLVRCVETLPAVRTQAVHELMQMIPGGGDPEALERRKQAAKVLAQQVFVGILGLDDDKGGEEQEGPDVPQPNEGSVAALSGEEMSELQKVEKAGHALAEATKLARQEEAAAAAAWVKAVSEEEAMLQSQKETDELDGAGAMAADERAAFEAKVEEDRRVGREDRDAAQARQEEIDKEEVARMRAEEEAEEEVERATREREDRAAAAVLAVEDEHRAEVAASDAKAAAEQAEVDRKADEEMMKLSLKEQISLKLQNPDKDPVRQIKRLGANVGDLDMRLEMLAKRVDGMTPELIQSDKKAGIQQLIKVQRQCIEFGELIMSLTEGLDSVHAEEARQERRKIVAQLQGMLSECDRAHNKIASLLGEFNPAPKAQAALKAVGAVFGAIWNVRHKALALAACAAAAEATRRCGGVDEAGYALRDVVLNTCDIALPYLKRVQDAMFPDPSRMNMKKRLTTRDLEAMYEKEAREIQQIQQRSMQERERERKDREAKKQREALKGEFIKKVSSATGVASDAVKPLSGALEGAMDQSSRVAEEETLKAEKRLIDKGGGSPIDRFGAWWKSLA